MIKLARTALRVTVGLTFVGLIGVSVIASADIGRQQYMGSSGGGSGGYGGYRGSDYSYGQDDDYTDMRDDLGGDGGRGGSGGGRGGISAGGYAGGSLSYGLSECSGLSGNDAALCRKLAMSKYFGGEGGVDCIECMMEASQPEPSGWEKAAMVLGATMPSLASLGSNIAWAHNWGQSQDTWANAYNNGLNACNTRFQNYTNYLSTNGMNPLGPQDAYMMMQCNGLPTGGYAGFNGMLGNGLGGSGNPYLGAGYTPGFLGGMGGPYMGGGLNATLGLGPFGGQFGMGGPSGGMGGPFGGGTGFGGMGPGMGSGLGAGFGIGMGGSPFGGMGGSFGGGMNGGFDPFGGINGGFGGGGNGGFGGGLNPYGGGTNGGFNPYGGLGGGFGGSIGFPGLPMMGGNMGYPGLGAGLGLGVGGPGAGMMPWGSGGIGGYWGASGGWGGGTPGMPGGTGGAIDPYTANYQQNMMLSSRYQTNLYANSLANMQLGQDYQRAGTNYYNNAGSMGMGMGMGMNPYAGLGGGLNFGAAPFSMGNLGAQFSIGGGFGY
ncbi:MAG: hypothetical protein HQK50_14005 [Oligoflexia bacterium]|nr:hypothetical protein [Oligoflexia bacterium]